MRPWLPLATLIVLLPWAAHAQPAPDEDPPECPEHSTRGDDGACVCDDGYEFSEDDLQCLIVPCPDNAERPPGAERDPFACDCVRGHAWAEDGSACVPHEPCPGENQVRDEAGECGCPDHATDRGDGTGCDCDEGWLFDAAFYGCVPAEAQCPQDSRENPHHDPGKEGSVPCLCEEGFRWQRATMSCTRVPSECGPHAHSAEGGTGCVCDEGFYPGPPGTLGCVGEIQVRCQPNAHKDPDTEECVCNAGYDETADGQCKRPASEQPFPAEGEGEGDGDGDPGATRKADDTSGFCAVGLAGRPGEAGWAAWALLLGLLAALRWRPRF